jgi:hypothetical protein
MPTTKLDFSSDGADDLSAVVGGLLKRQNSLSNYFAAPF